MQQQPSGYQLGPQYDNKGLRNLQMRENAVREAAQTNFACVKHVSGKLNFSGILTKEDKYKAHYITLRDRLMLKIAILSKVQYYIHICENISVIPKYGDRCRQSLPQNIFMM